MSSSPRPTLVNATISFEPEIREAELQTEFEIGGRSFSFGAVGARGCQVDEVGLDDTRATLRYDLTCSLTWFEAEHEVLGAIRIFQDPRIVNKGWILARRTGDGAFASPSLSYFNQHLIFHIGSEYLYYPRPWQVVSAITNWPPEYHQYHHLEDRTPVFDLVSRQPNVAVKGVSTISIKGALDKQREAEIKKKLAEELAAFERLPASKLSPEDLTSR